MNDFLNMERPEEKPGQVICDSCWVQAPKNETSYWVYFGFRHLQNHWLCVECQKEYGTKFAELQRAGL